MTERRKNFLTIGSVILGIFIFGVLYARSVSYVPDNKIAVPTPVEVVTEPNTDQSYVADVPNSTQNTGTNTTTETTSPVITAASTSKLPARLMIPSIKVNAKVQHVGLTKAGNMGIPTNFKDVAWYKYGAIPGQEGSAVIDGHVDNGLALPGVFKHLKDIAVGDDIYIVAGNGQKTHFIVTDKTTVPKNSLTTDIFSKTGPARLRLITCTGDWIAKDRTYSDRILITAELAP
jgi:LPXTG-site transpeptidase (sortase) family protein